MKLDVTILSDPNPNMNESTLDLIVHIQKLYPNWCVGGSAALILAGLLEPRKCADIDFISNNKSNFYNNRYFIEKQLRCILTKDKYETVNQDGDDYESFHGASNYKGYYYSLNLLLHSESFNLRSQTIIVNNKQILIQNTDDILYFKTKYNREKDQRDLEKISIKLIEDLILK